MAEILLQLAPIFVYFLIGVLIRRAGVADRSHGDFVLRLAFFVTLPLLILTSVSETRLTADKALLPVANIVVNVLCLGVALLATRPMRLARATQGSIAMSTMIVNNAFMFPFILAIYGDTGFADAVLFDFGNALMVATVTYATAFRYSDESFDRAAMLKRIAKAPVFSALLLGVVLSVTDSSLPPFVIRVIDPVADMTAPLILIALGISFSLSLADARLAALAIAVRMGLGLAVGLAFATLAGFEGETFAVVALCSAAPIGFMALTFTSLAKLDRRLTSTAVSLSILVGLIYIPVLMFFFE